TDGNGFTNIQDYQRGTPSGGGPGNGVPSTGVAFPSAGSGPNQDDDYDRISNSREAADHTPAQVDWALTIVDGAVPETLNELGQFVRAIADAQGHWGVGIWDGGEWHTAGSLGGGGTPGQSTRVLQNNAGVVAGVFPTGQGGYELRILDAQGILHSESLGQESEEPVLIRVTDSGFVFGMCPGTGSAPSIFRWRDGSLLVHPLDPGVITLADGNDQGGMIVSVRTPSGVVKGALFDGSAWHDTAGPVLALNNRGQAIVDRSSAAYWWENGTVSSLGVSLVGRGRVLLNDAGQAVFSSTVAAANPVPALFRDPARNLSLPLRDLDSTGNPERAVIANSINDVGEVVGYFAGGTPAGNEAFTWRSGEFSMSGADLPFDGSEFIRIANSGHIAA
ncbi:MAG: hypothetical protein ABL994_22910, partial [Verrucomicrobiales bacterium]